MLLNLTSVKPSEHKNILLFDGSSDLLANKIITLDYSITLNSGEKWNRKNLQKHFSEKQKKKQKKVAKLVANLKRNDLKMGPTLLRWMEYLSLLRGSCLSRRLPSLSVVSSLVSVVLSPGGAVVLLACCCSSCCGSRCTRSSGCPSSRLAWK